MSFVCLTHLDKRMEGQKLGLEETATAVDDSMCGLIARENTIATPSLFLSSELLFSPLIPADDGLYSVGCTSSFCLETGGDRTWPATSPPPPSSSTRRRLRHRS